MAVNQGLESILRSIFRDGVYVSLHAGKPGRSGQPLLAGPFRIPLQQFSTRNGKLVNSYIVELGESIKSGQATYGGVWTSRTNFLGPVKLKRNIEILSGTPIRLSRYGIEIGVEVVSN